MEILEKAPAKLNLSLDTPFVHQDGEPEWNMVMTAIDLSDHVYIKTIPNSSTITVKTDSGFLPCDERNLAYQAAKLMQSFITPKQGVEIEILKKIPVSAGMGGGSADAAAVLRGLNKLWKLKFSNNHLAKLALQIDSDVPFCVYNKPSLVTGRGEIIQPIGTLPQMWIIVAKPSASVSTPSVLKQIREQKIEHQNVDKVVLAIKNNDYDTLSQNIGNALEPITQKRLHEIHRIKEKMIHFGADAASMSGSGPTVFGITQKYSRALHIYNSLRGFCKEVYLVRALS
ncbi:4-(cytidine 5-diphospho)-2-C-methyl-D-erythritol kinase [Ligilactobacillus hayakitensis DSM 18933 = JCM 14209]|uniref:4-diphosphocytidyl-2-C-methyl-D-erythritol kinase n=1 Tax=Ligilactobacillus hayakitensis DSM 18933 = JCM 14209 TaxID=1423755 RepID=A0A0R1WNS3_9LACO|nr:4-(cytidine 5'-diphospho)-2-C-methyl-D-erythritol kinase [Ligilactobacillus hayakitensis]KRM17876.1 4-(cytidine 5-diphospho)-2-C-methyl-D-erythritol kinase [Ligilactobacillus hayakitensis DSM 18933 = JCM 14209]